MTSDFYTFFLGSYHFAVAKERVNSIKDNVALSEFPLVEAHVKGLINVDGKVLSAIGLNEKLAIKPKSKKRTHIITDNAANPLSLMVEKMGDMVEVEHDKIEAPPSHVNDDIKELLNGIYVHNNELLLLLNIETL